MAKTVYLNKEQVGEIIGVRPRTALAMMMEMNPIPICGTVRKRYVVTEESLEKWMAKRMIGVPKTGSIGTGCNRKLERR